MLKIQGIGIARVGTKQDSTLLSYCFSIEMSICLAQLVLGIGASASNSRTHT